VTDNGANFIKAFKHFSLDEAEELSSGYWAVWGDWI